jgi:hypothetical protein
MEKLEILWLDDQRDPVRFFKSKPDSGAKRRMFDFYNNNIFNNYDVNFVWVKSYEEFINYIKTNGVPKFISFDYDLKNARSNIEGKLPNGGDCAKWLIKYCEKKGIPMPQCYAHTANTKQRPELCRILGINENKERPIKITENELRMIISECIKNTLHEIL